MADRTLADLYRSKDITDDQLAEAVSAYLAKPSDGPHKIGSVSLDIAAAIQGQTYARDMMVNPEATDGQKRNAVRTAMLLATAKAAK